MAARLREFGRDEALPLLPKSEKEGEGGVIPRPESATVQLMLFSEPVNEPATAPV